ncbi:hypothetical protein ABZ341_42710 [Streptomyces sp. NPDC006173]|uniref:hypothetical protein n=1 Tax=Streptomyces sp. NPDC006173 TaxID=3155349 RepID=UPI00341190EF
MPEVQVQTTELAAQYGTQVAADLERNASEQARISAELEALQEQLQALRHDYSVLVKIQQALGSSPATAADAVVPPQGASTTRHRSKPQRVAAGDSKNAASKEASAKVSTVKTAKRISTSTAQPSLVKLVRDHLEQVGEPRSAAEITTALAKDHPDRGIKTTVVRTTVENLVAKSRAQRTKQGSSVFYTSTPSAPSQPKTDSEN